MGEHVSGRRPRRRVKRWRRIAATAKDFAESAAFAGSFVAPGAGQLVLAGSCEAALLFSCISPTITDDDAMLLARLIVERYVPTTSDGLVDLVENAPIDPRRPSWEDGYELAASVLEAVGTEFVHETVDIEGLLKDRRVGVQNVELSDVTIRAISLVSPNHLPTIALNASSTFFDSAAARRFTLAHELCHLLLDRGSGAQLAVASGPWAPKAIEKRANAFAAISSCLLTWCSLRPASLESSWEPATGSTLSRIGSVWARQRS